ncbi:MAG: hypothetical protein NVS2B7_26770 [Herpetosiphon sp.]
MRTSSFGAASLVLLAIIVSFKPSDGQLLTPHPAVAAKASASGADMKLPDLPLDLQRRAAQLIEFMRGSNMAPGWDKARLQDVVRPLYRPDQKGTAYYEFSVAAPDPKDTAVLNPAGFIIISTGDHDYPIAHWDYQGLSPSRKLETTALQNKTAQPTAFYKLDALTYAGEDANGNLVATLGTPLVKVDGTDPAWLDQKQTLSASRWTPDPTASDTSGPSVKKGTFETNGPLPPASLQLSGWKSWADLKAGYANNLALHLQNVRRDALHDWTIDANAARYGEGLVKGQSFSVPLLSPQSPKVTLTGPGQTYVTTTLNGRPGLLPLYTITVIESAAGQVLPLTVNISYADQRTETLQFAIVGPNTGRPPVYLPVVFQGVAPQAAQGGNVKVNSVQPASDWGPWTFSWAGSHADQRLYNQFTDAPNTSSCYSGCGATAWAMLFGWADHQAALGNGYWAPRWGLYRQNGGYGADVDAPLEMDAGVRNMTWEIRNAVHTFCVPGGSGATLPSEMSNAYQYLLGRTGTRLTTDYNVLGISEDRIRAIARSSIADRGTPAVVGKGWFNHYPLAYGYAQQSRTTYTLWWSNTEYNRWFYVNEGWGGRNNGWIPADGWFAGQIFPN